MTIPRRKFKTIGTNVTKIVKPLISKRGFGNSEIINNWVNIVGDKLAQNITPQKISYNRNSNVDGVLLLRVNSSSVALEIQYIEKQIVNKINTYFGFGAIGRIKIIQGPIPAPEKKIVDKIKTVANTDKIELERKLNSVKDPDLRVALAALGTAIIKK